MVFALFYCYAICMAIPLKITKGVDVMTKTKKDGIQSINHYGYVRVSTVEQHIDRQINALLDFGIKKENIYIDKTSGKNFNRPAWKKMLRKMKAGDVLVTKSIDRLGRNYEDNIEQWRKIIYDKKCDIIILDMPLLDTTQQKDLLGTMISDLVLQILSYAAQAEREANHIRQAEGIAAAKARGVHFGRPGLDIPDNFEIVYKRYMQKELKLSEAAQVLNVDVIKFKSYIRRYRQLKERNEHI